MTARARCPPCRVAPRPSGYLWLMSQFKSTLLRVLVIQVVTLVLLWLLQSRYTP